VVSAVTSTSVPGKDLELARAEPPTVPVKAAVSMELITCVIAAFKVYFKVDFRATEGYGPRTTSDPTWF
jgi:hypothetical protein